MYMSSANEVELMLSQKSQCIAQIERVIPDGSFRRIMDHWELPHPITHIHQLWQA